MKDGEAKTEYLRALDLVLEPQGFHRRRNSQEWRKQLDEANESWIHINFGKAIINPSLGMKYLDLVSVLPQEAGCVTSSMTMLSSIIAPLSETYTLAKGVTSVARDLSESGLPFLNRLTDRAFVIDQLKSFSASDWPTPSYSHRIRLLPLLLAAEGRIAEAQEFLDDFKSESSSRDQIIPRYEMFVTSFKERFGC